MEPIAIVTAFVADLYIVGRGPLVVAPTATAAFYRRMLSNPDPGRVRIFGGLLVLLAAALIVTARQARDAQGGAGRSMPTGARSRAPARSTPTPRYIARSQVARSSPFSSR